MEDEKYSYYITYEISPSGEAIKYYTNTKLHPMEECVTSLKVDPGRGVSGPWEYCPFRQLIELKTWTSFQVCSQGKP